MSNSTDKGERLNCPTCGTPCIAPYGDGVQITRVYRPISAPSATPRVMDRDALVERVEAYFHRVSKLGGDTGECSAEGVADFLLHPDKAIALSHVGTTGDPIDPDTGKLRDDLEAVAGKLYERLHREVKQRFDVNLPGHATTDKVLEVLEAWASEALSARSATGTTEDAARRERIELLQRDVTLERCAEICESQVKDDEAHGRLQARSILARAAASIRALKTSPARVRTTDGRPRSE